MLQVEDAVTGGTAGLRSGRDAVMAAGGGRAGIGRPPNEGDRNQGVGVSDDTRPRSFTRSDASDAEFWRAPKFAEIVSGPRA